MIDKLLNIMDKFNIRRATELVNNETVHPSGNLVYPVETMIMPKYRHVKTPLQVKEFLESIKEIPLRPVDPHRGNLKFCKDSLAYSRRQETQERPVKPFKRNIYVPLF